MNTKGREYTAIQAISEGIAFLSFKESGSQTPNGGSGLRKERKRNPTVEGTVREKDRRGM